MNDDVTRNAIRVAATLGIPDLIAHGIDEPAAIADSLGTNVDATTRLLRHLVARGAFTQKRNHKLALTKASVLLTTDHPLSRKAEFDVDGVGPRLERALSGMLYSIQTGESGYVQVHGKPLWEEMGESRALTNAFDSEMEQHARSVGARLLVEYDWNHVHNVVDVGGGTGALLRVLLTEHAHLRGTVVEMADAAGRARSLLSEAGLSNRSEVFEGSFFEPLPKAADVYLLSWILHDWADGEAIQILQRCREAMTPDGRILIIEKPLDRNPDTALDLRMLVFFGGKERYLPEYEEIIDAAGLKLFETIDLQNGFSALVCGMARTGASPA
jgi:hypothetical protein